MLAYEISVLIVTSKIYMCRHAKGLLSYSLFSLETREYFFWLPFELAYDWKRDASSEKWRDNH